jgi:1-deoxyxylulose-5-phosphate synthase
MEYRNLGRSGLKVSRLCLGTMAFGTSKWRPWVLNEADSLPIYQYAFEIGINFIDTSDWYSDGISEEITGKAIQTFTKRNNIILATKVYYPSDEKPNQGGLSRVHIMRAVRDSLKRLGTDYIDLYQIHRWDYSTPIEETLEALHDLIKLGMVHYIGASTMFAWQFAKSLYLADLHNWARFVSMQNHYNLVYREEEREMIPFCIDQGIGIIPWSPLARGFLAGTRPTKESRKTIRAESDELLRNRYTSPSDYKVLDRLVEMSREKETHPAQIALAWLLNKPYVTCPIIGVTKIEQLKQSDIALKISLSEEEIDRLEEAYELHPNLGFD